MEVARKVWKVLLELAETLVIAGAIFVVVYAFLIRPFQVTGQSMHPTFQNGEYVFTNLLSQRFGPLDRGDVIVFKAPPSEDKDYIKRIIGIPGDRVKIENGKVYLNGSLLQEPYIAPDIRTDARGFAQEGNEVTVSEDTYFVMGDNRPFSSDSRDWGLVPFDKVIGKSAVVYWPLNRMRIVQHEDYK